MKRYTLLLYILAAAAFLLSASCSRKDTRPLPEELTRAEHLMWEAPDSALYVLQSMPVPSESQRLARATWALLTAQARYKLFLPQTDSLIHIACDYFHRHGDARQKAYAYLYKAGISRELQREDEAQRFYQLAAEEVEQTDDARLGYLIYIGLSELYAYQDMGEHSLRMADKAMEYAGLCKDSAYICSAAMLRARAYTVLDSLRMAACCYKESLRFANNPIDMSDVSNELAGIYRRLNMLDSALCYMRQAMAIDYELNRKGTVAHNVTIGTIYLSANKLDSATYYTEKILADTTATLSQIAAAHQNLYFLYQKQGIYQKAAKHCFQFSKCLYSIFQANKGKDLAKIQAKYDHQKVLNEKNAMKVKALLLLISLLVIIVVLTSYLQWKLRQKKLYIRQVEEEIKNKTVQIQDNKNQIDYLTNSIAELDILKQDKDRYLQYIENLKGMEEKHRLRIEQLLTVARQ